MAHFSHSMPISRPLGFTQSSQRLDGPCSSEADPGIQLGEALRAPFLSSYFPPPPLLPIELMHVVKATERKKMRRSLSFSDFITFLLCAIMRNLVQAYRIFEEGFWVHLPLCLCVPVSPCPCVYVPLFPWGPRWYAYSVIGEYIWPYGTTIWNNDIWP